MDNGIENTCLSLFYDSTSSKLVIGGVFEEHHGITVNYVLTWNNSAYSEMGNGLFDMWPKDFELFNDTLFSAGISSPSTPSFRHLAKFDTGDSLWKPIPNWKGVGLYLSDLVNYKNDLIIVGDYRWNGGIGNKIVSFDGTNFNVILNSYSRSKSDMFGGISHENYLYLFGRFDSLDNKAISHIARWDGNTWSSPASNSLQSTQVNAMVVFNDTIYAGTTEGEIYKLDNMVWKLFASANGQIRTMVSINNNLYIGGFFSAMDSLNCNNICFFDGDKFNPMGQGTVGTVAAIAQFENDLIIGGSFTKAGGKIVNHIARWGEPVGVINQSSGEYLYIDIVPNPSKNHIRIELPIEKNKETFVIKFFNNSGSLVSQKKFVYNDESRIDISNLNQGIFLINIISESKVTYHGKFIKE